MIINYKTILSRFKITELNPMQRATLEAVPQPDDLVLISPTGSGKTLGFLLPLLQLLGKGKKHVQVLVVVPSRELAIQIEQVFKQLGTSFKINSCYGGHSVRIEENNLKHPPAVLVGTPGRIAHHLRRKKLITNDLHTLVLDEFDKSLEFGFKEEMAYIVGECSHLKKRILTSATALKKVPDFVGLQNPVVLDYTKEQSNPALILRTVRVENGDKLATLLLLLGKIGSRATIVFCNHREEVDRISEQLRHYKVDHGFYHGGLEQIDREKTLIKLRNGTISLLVTTDLAARGLDIPEIQAVVHFQLPPTEEVMIHRNGRTARMNAGGIAYFLLDTGEQLPAFLEAAPEEETLPRQLELPKPGKWKTIYVGAGKKDKINKMDIVGMFLQKGQLQKEELGKIEVLDNSAYVAVRADKVKRTLELVKNQKIKNRKIRIEVAS